MLKKILKDCSLWILMSIVCILWRLAAHKSEIAIYVALFAVMMLTWVLIGFITLKYKRSYRDAWFWQEMLSMLLTGGIQMLLETAESRVQKPPCRQTETRLRLRSLPPRHYPPVLYGHRPLDDRTRHDCRLRRHPLHALLEIRPQHDGATHENQEAPKRTNCPSGLSALS